MALYLAYIQLSLMWGVSCLALPVAHEIFPVHCLVSNNNNLSGLILGGVEYKTEPVRGFKKI